MGDCNNELISIFPSLQWAHSYLESPQWRARPRSRPQDLAPHLDQFIRTIRASEGISRWYELQPTSNFHGDSEHDCQYLVLLAFGTDLTGYPGLLHGGAVMTILDEAMGFAVMAYVPSQGIENVPLTADCSVKFLKPVDCPGSVGIKVKIVENGRKKTKVEATMIDSGEREVAKAESVWIRPGYSIGKL